MLQGKKILSVVTARADSKGLVGKNYRFLHNHPLFMYSVYASLESRYVSLTVVSSNCPYVEKFTLAMKRKMDENLGILNDEVLGLEDSGYFTGQLEFIRRPDEYATATSKNEEALIHAYNYCKEYFDFDASIIVNLQPTSPIRSNGLLDKCIKKMIETDADSLLTVKSITPFTWKIRENIPNPHYDVVNRPMRQDLSEQDLLFHDNGNIYIICTDVLLKRNCRIGWNPVLFETDKFQSLQIDDEDDFILIEQILRNQII